MSWQKIDLWPEGPAGIEAKYRIEDRVLYCYAHGSNHVLDWLHHVLPGEAERERRGAIELFKRLIRLKDRFDMATLGGHSLGAPVAIACADMMEHREIPVVCYAFGGKRPLMPYDCLVYAYRHSGDIVPALPPWRQPYRGMAVFGTWTFPWLAHKPERYEQFRQEAGLL